VLETRIVGGGVLGDGLGGAPGDALGGRTLDGDAAGWTVGVAEGDFAGGVLTAAFFTATFTVAAFFAAGLLGSVGILDGRGAARCTRGRSGVAVVDRVCLGAFFAGAAPRCVLGTAILGTAVTCGNGSTTDDSSASGGPSPCTTVT
jgi:hypothetical protein